MKRGTWCLLALTGAAAFLGTRIYRQRPLERLSVPEGLDDPAVAAGFIRVSAIPQMRLLRWYVAQRAVGMVGSGRAIDLGCGPGQLVLEMARQAPDLHVTGVDISEGMLATARQQVSGIPASKRTDFRLGSGEDIPFADRSVDLVVSTLSLHHWSEPTVVLNEIERVLKPGGAYLVFDLRRDISAPPYLALWFITRVAVPQALKRANEPLSSRNAAYTPREAADLARASRLTGWGITQSALWLTIEGRQPIHL